jgi:hypothetical protein
MRGSAAHAGSRAPGVPRILVAAAIALLALLLAVPASAHEDRRTERYNLVVGFGDEPAYAGAKNSVQVMVNDQRGRAVRDLRGSLKVMLMAGGQQRELPLEPHFGGSWGTPGDYRAFFIPTAAGDYTFHVRGSIAGQRVDERFTSSPRTFASVEDPNKVSFPAAQASSGQLAARVERESARTAASLQQALDSSRSAEQRAREVAGQTRLLAGGALLVGLIGLVLAGIAMVRRPAPPRRAEPEPRHLQHIARGV